MSNPQAVRLDAITVDESLQPRCDGLDEAHVQALAETPEDWPPVVLASDGDDLKLVDGFHRLEAAQWLGYEAIQATVFTIPDDRDLFRIAFQLNASHGRPLDLRDRKRYADFLIQKSPELSDREVGRRTGLHHETVGGLRRGHEPAFRVTARKPGDLPDTIGLLDPIRRAKATRDEKAIAGYVQRVVIALADPYEENSALDAWSDDPAEIARACFSAMGEQRATTVLSDLETDASFLLKVGKARKHITSNGGIQ